VNLTPVAFPQRGLSCSPDSCFICLLAGCIFPSCSLFICALIHLNPVLLHSCPFSSSMDWLLVFLCFFPYVRMRIGVLNSSVSYLQESYTPAEQVAVHLIQPFPSTCCPSSQAQPMVSALSCLSLHR